MNWSNGSEFSLVLARVAPAVLGQRRKSAWSNEDSRGAEAQGRPNNRKSERHLRVHRAALRPRLPRPMLSWAGPAAAAKNGLRSVLGHMSFGTADSIFGLSFN